ncbi:MAG: RNA methyltransferase [Bacteroidales bacterium]|nr:RNA methyltransferase [Bacteroidales bacterium]
MAGLSSNQIKFIRSLSQKKFRQESGLFVAEGEKIVNEALSSPFKVKAVYRSSEIGEECMKRISNLASPSPVLAVIEQRREELRFDADKLAAHLKNSTSGTPLFLALDGVKDPGNMGTIIRLADWFGIDAIFASHESVEIYNPKVVQATMGAIFRKPVIYADLGEVIETFTRAGMAVHGTFLNGKNLYETKNIQKSGLIVMGSESFGISKEIEEKITSKLLIPPYPADAQTSESLNVAIATAIICAEFRRPQ